MDTAEIHRSLIALAAVGAVTAGAAGLRADVLEPDAVRAPAAESAVLAADAPVNGLAHPIPLEGVTIAMALTVDRDEAFVPAGKREMIASVSVRELAPTPTRAVLPAYPVFARRSRLQGRVCAWVLVDTSGKVARIGAIKGQAVFHRAVREAAAQWLFTPARQGDIAVATWVTIPFDFQL